MGHGKICSLLFYSFNYHIVIVFISVMKHALLHAFYSENVQNLSDDHYLLTINRKWRNNRLHQKPFNIFVDFIKAWKCFLLHRASIVLSFSMRTYLSRVSKTVCLLDGPKDNVIMYFKRSLSSRSQETMWMHMLLVVARIWLHLFSD